MMQNIMKTVSAIARKLASSTRPLLPVLVTAFAAASCSDSKGPDNGADTGRFTLTVQGPTNMDLEGSANVYPGLRRGDFEPIETISLASVTTNFTYRLEIKFTPPVEPRGSFSAVSAGQVRATFYIFDRTLNDYSHIVAAQSGTLTITDECTLDRCVGVFSGQFPLGSTVQISTITAAFHAQLQ